ncbi:MAG: LacI family DNA-binding transcriptional regulator [Mycetocola sp.]
MVTQNRQARATIYDVAQRAGVSKSLVSLVLREPHRVSQARRDAVTEAIAELDYRPSKAASALAGNRSKNIGVAIDDFTNLWFVDVLRGMRSVLDGEGFHISVADAELNAHLGLNPIDGFLSAPVDGLVLAGEFGSSPALRAGTALAVVGSREDGLGEVDRVSDDAVHGIGLVRDHLSALGHTEMAHLSGPGGVATARRLAYETLAGPGARVLTGTVTDEQAGYDLTLRLVDAHPGVTAIVAANDLMATGAVVALRERGRRVPEDVSVTGYDDSTLASSRLLPLTTVDDRSFDQGVEAARAILLRMESPDRPARSLHLEPRLVVRGTTAPVPV